eukprot:1188216-Prorocentrum_minimum.AAC.2
MAILVTQVHTNPMTPATLPAISFCVTCWVREGQLFNVQLNRQSNTSYEIARLVHEYLPEYENTGEVVQPFTDWKMVLDFLNDELITQLWQDSTCGDGRCVRPFETISWGQPSNIHGCRADCGVIGELTDVTVYLDYTTVSQVIGCSRVCDNTASLSLTWGMGPVNSHLYRAPTTLPRTNAPATSLLLFGPVSTFFLTTLHLCPGLLAEKLSLGSGSGYDIPQPVEWNVCTRNTNKLVEQCWFETAQVLEPGQEVTETLQLPDDKWYLGFEVSDGIEDISDTGLYFERMESDTKYVRGSLSAVPPEGRSCDLDCTAEVCVYVCTDAVSGDPALNLRQSSRTSLFNFEMCDYHSGANESRSWRDYTFDGAQAGGGRGVETLILVRVSILKSFFSLGMSLGVPHIVTGYVLNMSNTRRLLPNDKTNQALYALGRAN